jgi:hypothetical protein
MDFGGEQAVVTNTSSNTRSVFVVRGGIWHTLRVVIDDTGEVIDGDRQAQPTRITAQDFKKLVRVVLEAQIDAYRASLSIPRGDPLEFMRDAAERALPYLTAGGR